MSDNWALIGMREALDKIAAELEAIRYLLERQERRADPDYEQQ